MTAIYLDGGEEMRKALASMSDEIRANVSRAVIGTALEIQGEAKERVQRGSKTGRVYKLSNPTRTHQASAPGQAPATDLGRLVNSITFDQRGQLSAVVDANALYAAYLEYGTRHIAPRPFFRPAAEAKRQTFGERVAKAVARGMK